MRQKYAKEQGEIKMCKEIYSHFVGNILMVMQHYPNQGTWLFKSYNTCALKKNLFF